MIKAYLTFTFLLGLINCFGQTNYQLDKGTSKNKKEIVYVLKLPEQPPLVTPNLLIDIHDIDSITIKKGNDAINLYGSKASLGAIEIHLKKKAAIINFDQLLADFNIAYTNNKLPVFIDSVVVRGINDTYFELTDIKSVSISEERETGMKYISIISFFPARRHKKNDIYIKGNIAKS